MDARTAESRVISERDSWLQRERASGRFYDRLGWVIAAFLAGMMAFSVWVLRRGAEPGTLLKPPLIALLLIAILLPSIALMALYARRMAVRRAEQGGLGSGRLHVRLVALFSVIAAVPTVLVAIFASLLFQSGLEFWFSGRARGMLENSVQLARTTYNTEVDRVSVNTVTAAGDLASYLRATTLEDPRFQEAFARNQVLNRNLSEAIIFTYGKDKQIRALALVNPYDRPLDKIIPRAKIEELKSREVVPVNSTDRIGAVTKIDYGPNTYLYAARVFEPQFRDQIQRSGDVLADYRSLLAKSRANQLRFNAALLLGALIIVGLAIFTALKLADRMVRPVGELVGAAGRIEEGDFSARVPVADTDDEIQTLATAFNRMAGRLDEQTGALRSANTQLDARRAFMEAVLSSVTAGVIALDTSNRILLVNRSAETLLQDRQEQVEGKDLIALSPDLAEFMRGEQSEASVIVTADS